ncbi:MAG: hypothetical protein H8E98_03120 [Bacteroidetes bacterium]|nr:hypothetical protein [Bacteroidota bacterium]
MQTITLEQYIEENRLVFIDMIREYVPLNYTIDDDEIREWILNDEVMYRMAIEDGVEI